MQLVGTYKTALSVEEALNKALEEINKKLNEIPGRIKKMIVNTSVHATGAGVEIILAVDGNERIRKRVFGVNVRGSNEEKAFEEAMKLLDEQIKNIHGEVVGLFRDMRLSPIPGRGVYCTLVMAVNIEGES